MLSFPEWLKPIRRHSAISILSGSSMTCHTDANKERMDDALIRMRSQDDELITYNNTCNRMNSIKIMENHDALSKHLLSKPSKSAWGKVNIHIIKNHFCLITSCKNAHMICINVMRY